MRKPRMTLNVRCGALSAAVFLGCLYGSVHAEPRLPLRPEERTNGAESLSGLDFSAAQARRNVAKITNLTGRYMIAGTWLDKNGYLVTKASELPHSSLAMVQGAGEQTFKLREIRRDPLLDLVLMQVVGFKPEVNLSPEMLAAPQTPTFGQWLASPTDGGDAFRIGVLSAQRRKIPGMGAAIGVRMESANAKEKSKKGVRILGVAEDSPAAAAGLRTDDVLLELAGEEVGQYQRVHDIISKRQPGEEIDVRYSRAGKVANCLVRLASRTKVLMNWEGEDFANGGISIRTDNFPMVLQHDVPLSPKDMGSPLLDLEGHLVGINIARVDRVTTFALPTDVFWPKIQKWIEEDRHPPKAVPATPTAAQKGSPSQTPATRTSVPVVRKKK